MGKFYYKTDIYQYRGACTILQCECGFTQRRIYFNADGYSNTEI